MTCAQSRRLYGKEERNVPSRFLHELPIEWLKDVGYKNSYLQQSSASQSRSRSYRFESDPASELPSRHTMKSTQSLVNERAHAESGFKLGQRVQHPRFGEGTIVNMDGEGDHRRAQVAFVNEGIKWLVLKLAKLEPVN